ncbi:MAG: hypothetical protein CNE93_04810 [SAR116 cluster bacterium MED-G06]|nr:MAG: hypothetical protein CNE93_04810 [SAR116 cluster bacterium MED-G06]
MDRIREHVFASHNPDDVNVIDGVRVRASRGWWLIRASNTEAALVARAEAEDKAALDGLVGDIEAALGAAGLAWVRP